MLYLDRLEIGGLSCASKNGFNLSDNVLRMRDVAVSITPNGSSKMSYEISLLSILIPLDLYKKNS